MSVENVTADDLDQIIRDMDGWWPETRDRILVLIRDHDAALIEGLADEIAVETEMVERGARAVAALDWDAEHGGVDPSDEEIARAVLSAALGAQEARDD